jgi:maleamate amidohydrolase
LTPMLLIIDILNDFLDRWSVDDRAMLIRGVRSLVDVFRAKRYPILWVRQEFKAALSDAFHENATQGHSNYDCRNAWSQNCC